MIGGKVQVRRLFSPNFPVASHNVNYITYLGRHGKQTSFVLSLPR